jgi:hypothetical protein
MGFKEIKGNFSLHFRMFQKHVNSQNNFHENLEKKLRLDLSPKKKQTTFENDKRVRHFCHNRENIKSHLEKQKKKSIKFHSKHSATVHM